jgi:hypothetical protein
MVLAGIDLQLAEHGVAEFGLRQHAAHALFEHALGAALADDRGALFAQAAGIAAVVAIDLLIFLAAGQRDRGGVDDDHVIARVDERGVGGLVLPLQQLGGQGRDPSESLALGVDDMPPAHDGFRGGDVRAHAMKS